MVRAAALILLLAGCSQQPETKPEDGGENPYARSAAEIAAEQQRRVTPPKPSPSAPPSPTIDELRQSAEQSALRAEQSQEFYEQQQREQIEARVRKLEDAQINGAH